MKKVIAIVAGGDSSEHEVSLRSAAGIESWIDKDLYDVYIVEVSQKEWVAHLHSGKLVPVYRHNFSFRDEMGRDVKPDYAYITIHGTPGEDGVLQGYFDLLQIPYSTSNVLVEALTFNKFALNQFLKGFGVKVAESVLVREGQQVEAQQIFDKVGLPCFIKPNAGGSSFGVTHCKTLGDVLPAIEKAMKESPEVLIESELKGTEISNGAYRTRANGMRVLPITEVVPKTDFFDYDAKYNGLVEEITPARLSEETTKRVQTLTGAIYDLLGASGIIRIDYIISRNEAGDDVINMLEINTTPGMTATSFIPQQVRAAGLEMKDVLNEIIAEKLS
ncbi:MAG: D-alanine--D-alanine ligase [Bacteroidaceae bacterium]|nr:D-alanine--D-alanine ligase [Bacteroidaceae bacterium]